MTTATRKLGQLTDAQRATKLRKAAKLQADAAALLTELFDDRSDASYRMTYAEQAAHYELAKAATAAEQAAKRTADTVADLL